MSSSKGELCTSYAAMALYDGEAEITSEQLKTLIAATGNEVEAYWPILFASLLQKINIEDLLLATSSGSAGPASAEAAPAEAVAAVEEKKVEEEEEEIDMGGGMDMFGGGEAGADY